jgi:hypothetical protein
MTAGMSIALVWAAAGSAQAQTNYTNSVLKGCYAHRNISADTEPSALNTIVVGTFCFDGNGNILGTSSTPGLTGPVGNINGTIKTATDETGTYTVTNTPGDGMGTITTHCDTRTFVIRDVDANGLAHGFDFVLNTRNKKCVGPEVIGGSAGYQGPLQ